MIEIRINDERGIDSGEFLQLLAPDLQQTNNLIVKRKILQLLAQVSDFESIKDNLQM